MRTKQQHSGNMGYGGVTNGTRRSKNQLPTAATRAYSCRLLMLGDWTAAGRQDRSVVPSAPISTVALLFAFCSQEKLAGLF